MSESLLIELTSVVVLGIGAQMLAWRFKLPSILLLLVCGFIAGPITGFLDPDALMGDLLFPIVSVSVGIILFEGGLSLSLSEFRQVGGSVFNLITIGTLVTWALASLAAYAFIGFDVNLSLIVGSILVVTGPTVVLPLLRHVRPTGRVGAISKWEGITIDPIGAVLAVLVLEAVVLMNEPVIDGVRIISLGEAILNAIHGLFLTLFVGIGVSLAGAVLLVLMLKQRLVPDYLQNSAALMIVVTTFVLANVLQHEAGLLATTLLGIAMANQRYVNVRRIAAFKEDLRALLLAGLFILLGARTELEDLRYLNSGAFLFLAALMLVVRPAAVFLSSLRPRLSWKEQLFLSWMAPRGIVAAAVVSLFSFRLETLFPEQVGGLVPIVFLVIVGTVAVYGLTIAPLARWLGLAEPDPQGLLLIGAHHWARRIGEMLQEQGFKVLLVDSNPHNVRLALEAGLRARQANVLSEHIVDELDLGGIGRLLTLTPNDEINALATLHFSEIFESSEVFQLPVKAGAAGQGEASIPSHLRGRALFGEDTTYPAITARMERGAEIRAFRFTREFTHAEFSRRYGRHALPLFLVRGPNQLVIYTDGSRPVPDIGHTLIALVDPVEEESEDAAGNGAEAPAEPERGARG